jgi:hypothetical protein
VLHYETGGAKLTRGAMNLVAGLGSFMSGDTMGGITVAAGYVLAAGLIVYEMTVVHRGDAIENIPGNVGIGIAGVAAVYGMVRPFLYDKTLLNKDLAAAPIFDNLHLAVVPNERGTWDFGVSYSFSY